jgi:hypothetical protein
MPHIDSNRRKPAAAATLVALLAALLLSACGGSSKSSSSTASATTTSGTKTANGGTHGQFGARGAALRTCLQKNGITLPQRKPGQQGKGKGGPFGAGGTGGGIQLPKGVTRAQLQAAFKKCGGGSFRGGGQALAGPGGAQRFAKFSACMRKNGVNLPAPNTSGKGPIFNTKGIDTKGAAFKAADAKCVRELVPNGRSGGTGGAGGAAPPGVAAPGEGAPNGAPPSPE